jgi:hypothetical protein
VTEPELIEALRAVAVPPSGLMRASQLRRFLGVSDRTLANWRAANKPPHATRLNGCWYYSVAEVAEFLSAQSGKGQQPSEESPIARPPTDAHR